MILEFVSKNIFCIRPIYLHSIRQVNQKDASILNNMLRNALTICYATRSHTHVAQVRHSLTSGSFSYELIFTVSCVMGAMFLV